MKRSYWFITVMEKIEPDERFLAKFGDKRCWGFYSNQNWALEALHTNATDMWETIYDYAVLEKYYEGISNEEMSSRQFFKYDRKRNGYFEIDEPECVKHLCSFSIG